MADAIDADFLGRARNLSLAATRALRAAAAEMPHALEVTGKGIPSENPGTLARVHLIGGLRVFAG